jgi:integrase/recombinase XerC
MDQVVASKRGKKVELTCDCGCGTIFYRYRNKISNTNNYVSRQHRGAFAQKNYLQDQCGPYLSLATEYLEGAAKQRYRDTKAVRKSIGPFFRYLCEHGIEAISDVSHATITAFQTWAQQNGHASASKDTSALSVFFQWTIVEGLYEDESPVIPAIHGKRSKPRVGRPYSGVEMSEMRRLLEERGDEKLRAFFEIASESGMRKMEICRLRLEDVAIDTQTLKVGLPNKTTRERLAFFSDRASTRIREWLAVRKGDCGHEFLFQNYLGDPLLWETINNEFKRVLCKTY